MKLELKKIQDHPFFKNPGEKYWYLLGEKICYNRLKTIKLYNKHYEPESTEDNVEKIKTFFAYVMYNKDKPLKLFDSKENLLDDLNKYNHVNKRDTQENSSSN